MSSGARLPLLHCGLKGCSSHDDLTPHNHWDQDLWLTMHLHAKHRHKEMLEVPTWAWPCPQDIIRSDGEHVRAITNYEMHAVAFYNEADCYKEEEHAPFIGASVDRRMLSLMYKALNSETTKAY
eukprot:1370695-Karenia_brevis.AAC.1